MILSKKNLSYALLCFFTLFIYSTLRSEKDAFVITFMGAEFIPTLKLFGVSFFSIAAFFTFSKLSNMLSKNTIYYLFLYSFFSFLLVFVLLFPFLDKIVPAYFQSYLPFKYYMLSLFYIFAELWGALMLTLLFWRLCNDSIPLEDSKTLYPLFTLIGNLGLVASGFVQKILAQHPLYILSIVLVAIVGCNFCYYFINKNLAPSLININSKQKTKLNLKDSIKLLANSSIVKFVTIAVLSYGITINLFELIWKSYMKLAFPSVSAYLYSMGNLQLFSGIASICFMLSAPFFLKKFSWRTCALFTPISIFCLAGSFFIFTFFKMMPSFILFVAAFGLCQESLSKGVKYAFFDPTKEACFIGASNEIKAKGKAAADMLGGRLGKCSGSIFALVSMSLSSLPLIQLSPLFFVFFIIIISVWIFAIFFFNKKIINEKSTVSLC
jgi:AAA family ATP:ADP antiporter